MTKKKYGQKPRDAWIKDPLLKDWIILRGDDIECKYCKTIFKETKYCNLKDHAKTQKHIQSSAPFSCERQTRIEFQKVHNRKCFFLSFCNFRNNYFLLLFLYFIFENK